MPNARSELEDAHVFFENCSFWRQLSPWQAICFRVRGCLFKNRKTKKGGEQWTLASLFLAACQTSILVDCLLETKPMKSYKNDLHWNSGQFCRVFDGFPSRWQLVRSNLGWDHGAPWWLGMLMGTWTWPHYDPPLAPRLLMGNIQKAPATCGARKKKMISLE